MRLRGGGEGPNRAMPDHQGVRRGRKQAGTEWACLLAGRRAGVSPCGKKRSARPKVSDSFSVDEGPQEKTREGVREAAGAREEAQQRRSFRRHSAQPHARGSSGA